MRGRKNTEADFWSNISIGGPDDCWPWRGESFNVHGYGQFWWRGRNRATHQLAYEITNGVNFPPKRKLTKTTECVCHSCDNPSCANPAHLWLGTQKDNMLDKVSKGRIETGDNHYSRRIPERLARGDRNGKSTRPEKTPRGSRHGMAKLTENDVLAIRAKYATGDTKAKLSRLYGVTPESIGHIVSRRQWKHI